MEFEKKLKQLQDITTKLENPDITMDDGVKLYEEGILIAKECYKGLSQTKGKITIIKQDLESYKEETLV